MKKERLALAFGGCLCLLLFAVIMHQHARVTLKKPLRVQVGPGMVVDIRRERWGGVYFEINPQSDANGGQMVIGPDGDYSFAVTDMNGARTMSLTADGFGVRVTHEARTITYADTNRDGFLDLRLVFDTEGGRPVSKDRILWSFEPAEPADEDR